MFTLGGKGKENLCCCGYIWSISEDIPIVEVLVHGKDDYEIEHPKNWKDNARFIVAANPNNILKIIDYIEQLQARIKELESYKHVLSIRNQANLFMIGHIVDDLEDENDIQKIKDYLYLKLNYYQEKVNNQ